MTTNKSVLMLAIAGIWLGLSGYANAAGMCISDAAVKADKIRVLQSTLMVAALKCAHKPDLGLNTNYNEFVTRNRGPLGVHADALKAHFQARHGKGFEAHLNRYVTRVANVISLASFDDPRFCENVAALGRTAIKIDSAAVRKASFRMPIASKPLLGEPCMGLQVASGD